MQSSRFNVRVSLGERDEVFLMNTLSDAQVVVSSDVAALLDAPLDIEPADLSAEAGEALALLKEHGFVVDSPADEARSLDEYFAAIRHDDSTLKVTVLTTLQCNFACDYCYQGDHGDHNTFAEKMSLELAGRVAGWIEREIDRVRPEKLSLTFFGGEPLLNLPVLFYLSERLHQATFERGLAQAITVITNGLLLTEDIVRRLTPLGLSGIKVTLDGDRDAHNRMRPLRGGQGTFDRIVENVRQVAGLVPIAIGGNFDAESAASYPTLLEFLRQQEFADKLVRVNFKPVVRNAPAPKGILPLIPVSADGAPLNGACTTSAGAGGSVCDSCHFAEDTMAFLRAETKKRGFPTDDGVHMGPCQIHREHAHTIGPDGSLYACPGFTGEKALSTGHIDGRMDPIRQQHRARFDRLGAWKECGDCAFIPVCAGGCTVASHAELGDMNAPTCHKRGFESAVLALAEEAAGAV